jgi:hypothetical protein
MIREGDRIGNKDGIVVSILNQKMLVLQESMEYEYYINAPVAGQTLASLSVNQLINDNQEEIDPVNDDVIDDNNQVNNTPTTAINSENALTNIEELFN